MDSTASVGAAAVVVGAIVGDFVPGGKVAGSLVDSDWGTTAGVGASVSNVIFVGAVVAFPGVVVGDCVAFVGAYVGGSVEPKVTFVVLVGAAVGAIVSKVESVALVGASVGIMVSNVEFVAFIGAIVGTNVSNVVLVELTGAIVGIMVSNVELFGTGDGAILS